MCSLSEMKRYVECMAYSRRVRVQIKEKGMEERDGMVFYIYCLCARITMIVKCYTITHRLIIQTHKSY